MNSIIRYALYNDVFSNIITFIFLVFITGKVEKTWDTCELLPAPK